MKFQIRIPKIVVDVPDDKFGSQATRKQVANDFGKWLVRYIPSWAWRKFAKEKYPQLQDSASVTVEKEADGTGFRHLSPGHGEHASDLLMQVAEATVALNAGGFQEAALELLASVEDSREQARTILEFVRESGMSKTETSSFFSELVRSVGDYGYKWEKDGLIFREGGDVCLVLGHTKTGQYIGKIEAYHGKEIVVKLLSGVGLSTTKLSVPKKSVLLPCAEIMILHKYRKFEEDVNMTVDADKKCRATIEAIDPARGVFVRGKDPNKEIFAYWVGVTDLGAIELPA